MFCYFFQNVVVLINCGGTIDIITALEPEADVVFFIIDSHRPTDLCNIYSESQVCIHLTMQLYNIENILIYFSLQIRILSKLEDEENIPEFQDIFNPNEVSR